MNRSKCRSNLIPDLQSQIQKSVVSVASERAALNLGIFCVTYCTLFGVALSAVVHINTSTHMNDLYCPTTRPHHLVVVILLLILLILPASFGFNFAVHYCRNIHQTLIGLINLDSAVESGPHSQDRLLHTGPTEYTIRLYQQL